MTEGGWTAEAALAAARSEAAPEAGLARQVLLDLMASRTQVRSVGVNLNQAVATLKTIGEPPVWLAHAAATARRVVVHLDETATAVASRGSRAGTAGERNPVLIGNAAGRDRVRQSAAQ